MHALAPRPALAALQSLALAAVLTAAALCVVLIGAESVPDAPDAALTAGAPPAPQPPLSFVPNRGQAPGSTLYEARGGGIGVAFGRRGVALALGGGAATSALPAPMVGQTGGGVLARDGAARLALNFRGANPDPSVSASDARAGRVNYLVGDRSSWQRDLPTYGALSYGGLWQGIDMHFRGEPGNLKYEFAVAPGADPSKIALAYAGAGGLSVAGDGALQVATAQGTLRDAAPVAWQTINGRRVPVEARYRLDGGNGYGFSLGAYDRSQPLVVDPGLEYSTYLGGPEGDQAMDVAVDASGSAYVAGSAGSASFPTTPGAAQTVGGSDAFVSKFSADGSSLVYSTYLGGNSSLDYPYGIEVDGNGSAFVGGYTESSNFPTTGGALSTTRKGASDNFVTKLNAAGSGFVYSTYLGGTGNEGGQSGGLAIDSAGAAYYSSVTYSTDLHTASAPDSTGDAAKGDVYVAKVNPAGSALTYATYMGGTGQEFGGAIALGPDNSAYVGGGTYGTDYPTTPGVVDTTNADDSGFASNLVDAFVTKVNPSGDAFAYSTLLGNNSSDSVSGLAVDSSGAAYVGGVTYGVDFPTTAGAFDTGPNNGVAGFVSKLAPTATTLAWSTLLRSSAAQPVFIQDLDLGPNDTPYVTGDAFQPASFPTTPGAYDTTVNGGTDGFFTRFAANGSSLLYSTLFGGGDGDNPKGLDIDLGGKAYIAGWTYSGGANPFPTSATAYQKTKNPIGFNSSSTYDAFALKLDPGVLPQCTNGLDDDGDGAIDFPADSGCASATDDTEFTAPVAPPAGPGGSAPAPAAPAVRPSTRPSVAACERRVISLVRADKAGSKVKVSGLVGPELYGRSVTITGNYEVKGKTVKATVRADSKGRFSGRLAGPTARQFSNARYRAASGSAKSIELKLFQAMSTSNIKRVGQRLTIAGTIRKSLLGKRNPVVIRRLVCGRYRTVATVKPAASGRYSVSFAAPGIEGAALYRAESKLLVRKGSRKYAQAYARAVSITLTGSTG